MCRLAMISSFKFLWILVICVSKSFTLESPQLNKLSMPEQLSIESKAKLICAASSGDQPIKFEWLKDGKSFTSGIIEQLDAWTSSLAIYSLSLEHTGNYTCVATNDVGENRVTGSLFVTAPPHWVVQPFDIKVQTGERAIFHCEAEGSPTVKISWKRLSEKENILPLPKDSQVYDNGSLVISKAEKNKSGLYMCEVANGIGNGLKKNALLTVYDHPHVERMFDHVTFERGQVAHLACLAKGDPPLYFAWIKNNQFLNEMPGISERAVFSETPSDENIQFTLSISNVRPEDEGIYTCIGRNDFGSDQKDIRLMLVEKPHPPKHVEVGEIWSRSVRIKWSTPKSGNSPILSYSMEYWSNLGGQWNETVSSSLNSYIIRGLKPFTTYGFHMWASNNVGDSEPSEQLKFTTSKEEPSSPPLDFRIEGSGSTFVQLSWKPPPHEHWNGEIKGYYVGYKQSSSKLPYTYNTVEAADKHIYYVLRGLRRATQYLVNVQSFNEIGTGPSSEEVLVKTSNQEPLPQPILVIRDIGSTYLQLHWILHEDSKSDIIGYRIHFQKSNEKWQEISIPDPTQTSYTLTNLEAGLMYQVYITSISSSGISEPSEIATVRTSAEAIFHNPPIKTVEHQPVDDVTQILYIVVPVAIATVIIVIVIVIACVYVYSKRPLPSHPYGDLPASKNFRYITPVPYQNDMPITICGGTAMKYGSPYSQVPLTRVEPDDDEPIYESVIDDVHRKTNQKSCDEDIKFGTATFV